MPRGAEGNRVRLAPPDSVVEIARVLTGAGFETWCVGGAVRDALLGETHLDWDLATAATPAEVRRLFRRTVPVGIEFGTVGVLDRDSVMHEVTTFRRDVQTDGRHAVVEFGASLDDDLARRDFTINALAYDPLGGELRDPFGGRRDLAARLVRAVGDPEARMREDRLRALRAIRFAARFGFEIEPETWRAVAESTPFMTRLSRERVKQEIEKTMQQVRLAGRAFEMWRSSGILGALIPALADVSPVTLASLDLLRPPVGDARPDREMQRLIALMGDLAPRDAERALRDLRFANRTVAWVGSVLRGWAAIGEDVRRTLVEHAGPSDAMLRRWAGATGRTRARAVWRLGAVRFAAERALGHAAPSARAVASAYRRAIRIAFRDPVEIGDLAVDGDDLLSAGVPAGPGIRAALEQLLDVVLDDPSRNTREALLAHVAASSGRS